MKRLFSFAIITFVVLLSSGCNTFERNTYNTLATSKAVIDTAAQQYNKGEIPQTTCVRTLIADARKAQQLGADDLLAYHNILAAKGDVTGEVSAITSDISTLVANVTSIKSISASKPCGV